MLNKHHFVEIISAMDLNLILILGKHFFMHVKILYRWNSRNHVSFIQACKQVLL